MTKRIMAMALATVMVLSLVLIGNFGAAPTYAVDVVAEASAPWPTEAETEAPTVAPTEAPTTAAPTEAPTSAPVDVVTTASLVNEIEAFKAGITAEGSWIVSTVANLVSEEPLVLEGEFLHREALARKIALYTQDDERNVTARFSLTAPSLTILSPNARIQSGFFIGDIYVSAPGFRLVDQQVNGNVYFTTQEAKDTFQIDENSAVSGEIALIQPDVVTTASLVDTKEAFTAGIAADGSWITSVVKDLTFAEPLVLTGEFMHREVLDRKIALYSQDEERNVTRKFTVTAPSLTIDSPSARLQGGIFVGDVYVSAANFRMLKQEVVGNVYFTTQEAKDTFTMDEYSSVTGDVVLYQPDVVATASLVRTAEAVEAGVVNNGAWIVALLNDVAVDNDLFMHGSFVYRETIQRKLALYSQDDERKVTRRFTLEAPRLFVSSPNTRIEKGIFVGDIYVITPNFRLNDMEVIGNVYVSARATGFKMDKSSVSGTIYYANEAIQDAAIIDDASTFGNAAIY